MSLLVASAAAAGTYFLTREQPPVYESTATLILSQPSSDLNRFGVSLVTAPAIDVSAYRTAITSTPVLRASLQILGQDDASPQSLEEFRKQLSARIQDNRVSSLVFIDARDADPLSASESANAVAQALLAWDKQRAEQNLQSIVSALEGQIASLDVQLLELGDDPEAELQRSSISSLRGQQAVQLNSARALLNSAVGSLETLEPASAPLKPVAPSPLRNAALAFVLGVFLSYGVILLRDALDTRIKTVEELQRLTGLPVLASFPRQTGLRKLPREASAYLRTNLLFSTANIEPKVFLVTSATPSQGKSSISISLAKSFARNDHRTLLIDADLRKPVIFEEYRLERSQTPSLETFLQHAGEGMRAVRLDFGKGVSLDVIPSFEAAQEPGELLARNFKRFLDEQAQYYDVIVIDSAPLLPVADTLALAPHVTGTVLAASALNADRKTVAAALDLLERLGLRILGTALTNVTETSKGDGQAYGYGYGYGPSAEKKSADPKVNATPAAPSRTA